MRRTYYDLALPVTPGWTLPSSIRRRGGTISGTVGHTVAVPARWPAVPHVAFANLDYPRTMGAVKLLEFVQTYGPLDDEEIPEAGDRFDVSVTVAGYMQDRLRRAWDGKDARALWFGHGAEELERYDLPLTWAAGRVSLWVADCWTYLRLLLTRDLAAKRARRCANATCPAPYFVARRNNQRFCCRECANVVTQRNFRKRKKTKPRRK